MALFQIINRNAWGIISADPKPGGLLRLNGDSKLPAGVTLRADLTEQKVGNTDYEQYSLYNQLYYQATVSDVDVSGLRAMTFDGFVDDKRVSNPAAVDLDFTNKLARSLRTSNSADSGTLPVTDTTASLAGTANETWGMDVQMTKAGNVTSITPNMSTGTAATFTGTCGIYRVSDQALIASAPFTAGATVRPVATFDPAPRLAAGVSYRIVVNVAQAPSLFYLVGTPTNLTALTNVYRGGAGTAALTFPTTAAFAEKFGVVVNYVNMWQTADLISTTKALTFVPAGARLYLSRLAKSGASVVPYVSDDGGLTWKPLTLQSSRADPKFGTYTEDYLTAAIAGQNVALKLNIQASADGLASAEVKRYGLIFF